MGLAGLRAGSLRLFGSLDEVVVISLVVSLVGRSPELGGPWLALYQSRTYAALQLAALDMRFDGRCGVVLSS